MSSMTASWVATHAHSTARTATTAPTATLRVATIADRSQIAALQRRSLRALGREFYSDVEIESYLRYTPTLEEYLLADSTYYVAYIGDCLAGCGGWSIHTPAYSSVTRDPFHATQDPLPKVRAMYVHPDFARRGVGRQLLAVIERAIIDAGYEQARIDATPGGVRLYERCGYTTIGEMYAALPNGAQLRFVCMHKRFVEATKSDGDR